MKRINRYFLKDTIRLETDFSQTDQSRGIDPPPVQKPYSDTQIIIDLPEKEKWSHVENIDLNTAIIKRKSRRKFRNNSLQLDELAYLLWATQGVKRMLDSGHAFRTVPSAGCRHAFETYLAVTNIDSLKKGVYRYLPVDNKLVMESQPDDLNIRLSEATLGQSFIAAAPATFIWSAIPYRMEWRYGPASYKVIAIDIGHVCQNLYLAVQAIGCATCAIAAYNQDLMDSLIGVNGNDEFTVYLAPVGKR